jgi:uroporphyrinogen decarboxylase
MNEMTKRERVRAALAGEAVDHVPVALWRHDFLREWTPEDLVAATLEAYRADDWDFIKLNPRATYFAEAWGNVYERPSEQRQPRLTRAAVQDLAELRAVGPIDPRQGVFGDHLRALWMLVREVRGEVDVIQTIFSPLAVLAMLCGADAKFREFAEADGDAIHTALGGVTQTLAAYAAASVSAGASGIFFAPLAWASRDTCSDEFYEEFGRPYDLRVLATVDAAPFNVLHVCRNHNMLDSLLDYPVAAFNWADRGEGNPSLQDVEPRTPRAVMGGIDHTRLHTMSSEEITAQARDALAVGKGLLLTAGCAIRADTPAANRAAVAEAARTSARPHSAGQIV